MKTAIETALCKLRGTITPSSLEFVEDKGVVRIILNGKKVQEKNMQEEGNDFEGWAIASHICSNGEIVLDIAKGTEFQYGDYIGNGHLCRFLYRIMKFSKQYEKWFRLSPYLQAEADKFEKYLRNGKFVNNVGTGDAGNKGKYDDENAVEARMADPGVLKSVVKSIDVGKGTVYRQLPVGLFEEKIARNKSVFTGGKSAIDLWNIKDDEINIVELKTKNRMMGIITEIFFYSNYIFDLVSEDGLFQLSAVPKGKGNHRGYEEIYNSKIKKVNGIMLADNGNYHPWVCKCLSVLNDNGNSNLNYQCENYHLKDVIS